VRVSSGPPDTKPVVSLATGFFIAAISARIFQGAEHRNLCRIGDYLVKQPALIAGPAPPFFLK
ncbi:MAG: hypothetical protein ACLFPE_13870, partial [Bacteroidales bacterium]